MWPHRFSPLFCSFLLYRKSWLYEKCPLELRQCKNDSILSTKIPILKLPLFFITCTARGKSAAISNLESFLTEWSRSYIFFALEKKLKPLSVTNNSFDSRSATASHMGHNSSAHVVRSGSSQTDAVICK